jgi:Carboxypeptidase regulatory-like domain
VSDQGGQAIGNAKVTLEGKGLPPLIYTDSEGVFTFNLPDDVKEIKIKVEASGYERYDRRVDVAAKSELEDVRLQQKGDTTSELSGTVVDAADRPLQGARVTLDDIPGMTPVETSTDGVFNIRDIPKKYGEGVRVRVVMQGYQPNPYTEDRVLGAAPPIIKLRKIR